MIEIIDRRLSVRKAHELLLKLETAGLNDEFIQCVIDSKDNRLAKEIIRSIQNSRLKPTASQQRAFEIMGSNFFGISDAIKHFCVDLANQQIAELSKIPYSEKTLKELKNTHILMLVLPLSIMEMWHKNPELFPSITSMPYRDSSFAWESGSLRWYLIRKTAAPHSKSKTWEDQLSFLNNNDEVPTARVMVYSMIGRYLATGEHLFKRVYARTSSHVIGGQCSVRFSDKFLLEITAFSDYTCEEYIAIADARKPSLK